MATFVSEARWLGHLDVPSADLYCGLNVNVLRRLKCLNTRCPAGGAVLEVSRTFRNGALVEEGNIEVLLLSTTSCLLAFS